MNFVHRLSRPEWDVELGQQGIHTTVNIYGRLDVRHKQDMARKLSGTLGGGC